VKEQHAGVPLVVSVLLRELRDFSPPSSRPCGPAVTRGLPGGAWLTRYAGEADRHGGLSALSLTAVICAW
jgi:hypothetical protein